MTDSEKQTWDAVIADDLAVLREAPTLAQRATELGIPFGDLFWYEAGKA